MKKTVFLLFFILLHVSKSLKFEARDSIDGSTFQAGSTVELVCTNKPYTGVHLFFFDSRKVFTCIASACKVTENNLESLFSFESDIESGVFTWIIHAMEMKFNGKSFECTDGSNYINATVTVIEKLETMNPYLLVSIPAALIVIIVLIVLSVYYNKRNNFFLKTRDCCICSRTRADEVCSQPMMVKPISAESQRTREVQLFKNACC